MQYALQKYVPDFEVVDTVGYDWVGDPFSKGGWMMGRPGQFTTTTPSLRKLHGRTYFAGADIAEMEPGSIDGTVGSGAIVSRDVATALGREDERVSGQVEFLNRTTRTVYQLRSDSYSMFSKYE